ncbi:MAG: hypothetical protein ABI838_07330 [Chloroflexota bacterium]
MTRKEPPEPVEIPEDRIHDRFTQGIAIVMALTTMAAAIVEVIHERDSEHSNEAALAAQRIAIQAGANAQNGVTSAQVAIENFTVEEAELASKAEAYQGQLVPPVHSGPESPADRKRLELDQARWNTLAKMTDQTNEIKSGGRFAPDNDPYFPGLFLSGKVIEQDRSLALQDGANDERAAWSSRVTNDIAVLTLFAVALYLLGLSLTIELRVRGVLAGVGMVIVVLGSGWAAAVQLGPVSKQPAAAADEFVQGRQSLRTAYLRPDNSGYVEARDHFTRSINLHPTGRAYLERSYANLLIGSPQHAMFISITSRDALLASNQDLEQARRLGLAKDERLLNNLGATNFLLGLHDRRLDYNSRALDNINQAIELDPADPLHFYNRGIIELVGGDFAAATRDYERAVDLTIYEPPPVKAGTLRADTWSVEQLLAAALTPLELVAQSRPDLAPKVGQMKELIAGRVEMRGRPPGPSRRTASLQVDVFPATLQWVGTLPDLDPSKDVVSVQWYHLDTQRRGWYALPDVSGDVRRCVPGTRFGCVNRNQAGEWFVTSHFLLATARCIEDGDYRVELYVNGHLAGSAQAAAQINSYSALQAGYFRDLAIAFCRPNDWKPSAGAILGYRAGSTNADGSQSLYLFRYRHPGQTIGQEQMVAEDLVRSVDRSPDLYPASPTFRSRDQIPYFMGLSALTRSVYTYPGGYILATAGYSADGSVIVAVVSGSTAYFTGMEPYRILDSLIQRQ